MPDTHGSNVHTLRTPPTARFTPPPLVESQFDTYSSPDQQREHIDTPKTKTLFPVSIRCAAARLASDWGIPLLAVIGILTSLASFTDAIIIRNLAFIFHLLFIGLALYLNSLWGEFLYADTRNTRHSQKDETITSSTEPQNLEAPRSSKHDQLSTLYEQANWFATRPWRQLVTHPDVAALLEDRAVHLALLIEDLRTETTSPATLEKNS